MKKGGQARRKVREVVIPNKNYEDLANAIIVQACMDYKRKYRSPFRETLAKEEVKEFFHSDLFSVLTKINPEWLLHKLDERNNAKIRKEYY